MARAWGVCGMGGGQTGGTLGGAKEEARAATEERGVRAAARDKEVRLREHAGGRRSRAQRGVLEHGRARGTRLVGGCGVSHWAAVQRALWCGSAVHSGSVGFVKKFLSLVFEKWSSQKHWKGCPNHNSSHSPLRKPCMVHF